MIAQSSPFGMGDSGPASSEPLIIVDDNREEAELTKHLVESSGSDRRVLILNSGETLEAYLRGEGLYSDRTKYPIPTAILLDLKMPGMDGFQVLKWIGAQPQYSSIPVNGPKRHSISAPRNGTPPLRPVLERGIE